MWNRIYFTVKLQRGGKKKIMKKLKIVMFFLVMVLIFVSIVMGAKNFFKSGSRERNIYTQILETETVEKVPEKMPEKSTETLPENIIEKEKPIKEEAASENAETVKKEEITKKEEIAEKDEIEKEKKKKVPDSGIRICIDPGHYEGGNVLRFQDGTSYCEGEITLKIAQKLQEILQEDYGITSCLTRNSGTISINGYTNGAVDAGHISLRGEMAKGYDLFLSIHTNANRDGANGYPTCSQPVSINKPVIIANKIACEMENMLLLGNAVGNNLTEVNYRNGISTVKEFKTVSKDTVLQEWTDESNDSPDIPGTIYVRTGKQGDYYGVLRGAANAGVPGFIIEHGHHTVPEVRKQIEEGNLITQWAKADARGIARGFGLIKED